MGGSARRASVDSHVCLRGAWLLDLCSTLDLAIFNGAWVGSSQFAPSYTCHRSSGASVVDFMCGRDLP